MNENMEREVELKDLLYRVAQKWRGIIVGAMVIAALAALWQVAAGAALMLNAEKLAEARENYEITLNDYLATGERLQTQIENLRDLSAHQQEYNEKSQLMRIDPMNKWTGSFQFYVDSKYMIDPSLTYQNTDRTNRLIAAYASYLRSGELLGEILENNSAGIDEIRFLTEIYSVSVDSGAATITVNCVGAAEKEVADLLRFVQSKVAERYDLIQSTIGDHSYGILTESIYSAIDLALDERQKSNLLAIAEYANDIGKTNEEFTEWKKQNEPKKTFGAWHITKQAIKFLILGGILGVVVMALWHSAAYFLSSRLHTDSDWERYGLPVLGHIYRDAEKNRFWKIDRWISRRFGRLHTAAMDDDCVLTARNLVPVLKESGVSEGVFIGGLRPDEGEVLTQRMDAAADGIGMRFAGDILRDPSAAKQLEQTEKVLLLGEMCVTGEEEMEHILTLLKAWGKTVLGIVVVE